MFSIKRHLMRKVCFAKIHHFKIDKHKDVAAALLRQIASSLELGRRRPSSTVVGGRAAGELSDDHMFALGRHRLSSAQPTRLPRGARSADSGHVTAGRAVRLSRVVVALDNGLDMGVMRVRIKKRDFR